MATDDQPTNGAPEEAPQTFPVIKFGVRLATGRPCEIVVPADVADHEILDLAFFVLRPDGGLREAVMRWQAEHPPSGLTVVKRPEIVVPIDRKGRPS